MPKTQTPPNYETTEARFEHYLASFADVLGHEDRRRPFVSYCTGLTLPGDRKSVEPMAALLSPGQVSAAHQSLNHFVAKAPWSDVAMLRQARKYAMPLFENKPYCFIVDDTGIPKSGKLSVGVTRQYCGVLGKQDNCQVAVTISIANEDASLPLAHRLYLPETWANDPERRKKAGIPDEVTFKTKPDIALDQIASALAEGLKPAMVLGDAGYGQSTDFRERLTALGLPYAVGIQTPTTVWAPGTAPPPVPTEYAGRGRPRTRLGRTWHHKPISVKELALSLPAETYQDVTWREGTKGPMTGRYAALRVHAAHRDDVKSELRPEEWLLIEWPAGEKEPVHYHLATLPADWSLERLAGAVRTRWRIERDYQELKDELGFDHYEGRGWRGFHHHASLSIATYAFLMVERGSFFPSAPDGRPRIHLPERGPDFQPRGASSASGKTQPAVLQNDEAPTHRRPRSKAGKMPLLPSSAAQAGVRKG